MLIQENDMVTLLNPLPSMVALDLCFCCFALRPLFRTAPRSLEVSHDSYHTLVEIFSS